MVESAAREEEGASVVEVESVTLMSCFLEPLMQARMSTMIPMMRHTQNITPQTTTTMITTNQRMIPRGKRMNVRKQMMTIRLPKNAITQPATKKRRAKNNHESPPSIETEVNCFHHHTNNQL